MKKVLLSILLLAAGALVVHAQTSGFTIKTKDNVVMNSQTFNIWGSVDTTTILSLLFDVTNNGTAIKNTYMERHELSLIPGTQNYFCWDVCYPPFVGMSTTGVNINPAGTYQLGSVDYQPQGQLGMSTIRYVIWDYQNPNDSAWFIVNWGTSPAGVSEIVSGNLLPSYPNPASSYTNVKYELSGAANASLTVYNMLGSVVQTLPVHDAQGTIRLDVSSYTNGIYFYALVADGRTLSTRKFTVTH